MAGNELGKPVDGAQGKNGSKADAVLKNNGAVNLEVAQLLSSPPSQKSSGKIYDPREHHDPTALDKFLNENRVARLGLVTAEGVALSYPGKYVFAPLHDVTHPVEALSKNGVAFSIGLGMRVLLPKAGAARAIAAGVFTYFMAKDAIQPFSQAYSDVWEGGDFQKVTESGVKMGDSLGQLRWDFMVGGKVAGLGEGAGELGMKKALGEEGYTKFEDFKTDVLKSDKYLPGRVINKSMAKLDALSGSVADRLLAKQPAKPELPLEEKLARASKAESDLNRALNQTAIHKRGFLDSEGRPIGLSKTIDMILAGQDPRKMTKDQVDAKGKELQTQTYMFTQRPSGLIVAERPQLFVPSNKIEVPESGLVKPEQVALARGGTGPADVINATSIGEFAKYTKKEMFKTSEQDQQIKDAKEGQVGPVYAALHPNAPLDPGYSQWLGQMIELSNQVNGLAEYKQVAPLFMRGRDAAVGHLAANLGETGRNIHSLNMFSLELYTGYKRGIQKAGLDPNEVLANKNPPLNLVAFDGGAGPHTLPQIDGVWNVDLVHWPRNMEFLKLLRAGIMGHENVHDQYGGIMRFEASIRDQVIGDVVNKALGSKAQTMVDVPGQGKVSMQDVIVSILKANANENTADMGGAAHTGPNGALALGVLLQALRSGGKLETRNVFGKDFVSPENPIGIEAHGIDAWRIKLVAETIRQRANGDKSLIARADALDKYADDASRGGDYVWADMDNPGQKIVIPKADFDAVIPHLVRAQFNTPLEALKGKTYNDISPPDLPLQVKKKDQIADMIVDAIEKGRKPEDIPFDTKDYTMIQLMGAGLPAALKLQAKGMSVEDAAAQVNRISDYLETRMHQNDPHIDPLVTRPSALSMTTRPSLGAKAAREALGNALNKVPEGRSRLDRGMTKIGGYAGESIGRSVSRSLFGDTDPWTGVGDVSMSSVMRYTKERLDQSKAGTTDGAPVEGKKGDAEPEKVPDGGEKRGNANEKAARSKLASTKIDYRELLNMQAQGRELLDQSNRSTLG